MFKSCMEWLYPPPSVMECVQSLKSVERTLTMMNDKYAFQIDELRRKLSQDIRDQRPKRHCMCTLRRIKLFEHHKEDLKNAWRHACPNVCSSSHCR